jgi:hypothetical protein
LVELELGSSQSVLIGKDMIMGLGNSSLLSHELLTSLNQKNISFLYQARGCPRPGTIFSVWKDSGELALTGDLEKEWDCYCIALSGSGIYLQDIDDELKWIGGDKSGVLTVKNVYSAIASIIWQQPIAVGGKVYGLGILL